MAYDFQPRFPIDHVLSLVRLIRTGQTGSGKVLILVGSITGELGALLGEGPIFSTHSVPSDLEIEDACAKLESIEFSALTADPNFDPTPWIPIILFVIEWIIKRRQG
jgi:hypothetical protein